MPLRFREAYRAIELYEPGRLPTEIDLSDNTNLFGVAPSVRELLSRLGEALVTRYPSVFAKPLKQALAEKHGVAPENIVTGCGSDDVIDSALRAFCEPGDSVVFPSPTFGVVRIFSQMNAAKPVAVPMTPDFAVDAGRLLEIDARVCYVCTPNNPTGGVVAVGQIEKLDRASNGLVMVDEAYADYAEAELGAFVASSSRTISLRTFSKVYGLAGLRVGYAVGPEAVIHEIEKSRGPYKVGGVAEAAAICALADGTWVAEVVQHTKANRTRLAAVLTSNGLEVMQSFGNFLLIRLPETFTALGTNAALRTRGVAVRPFPQLPHAGECIRVTIGPWEMMERFVAAFTSVLEGKPA